mmetsp:Transcript_8793/g.26692  ORF Transcript_8793/g.26692 Transcript_8793/m.26692 type:complete len:94 (-) Transcript_8793:324-605(-)
MPSLPLLLLLDLAWACGAARRRRRRIGRRAPVSTHPARAALAACTWPWQRALQEGMVSGRSGRQPGANPGIDRPTVAPHACVGSSSSRARSRA